MTRLEAILELCESEKVYHESYGLGGYIQYGEEGLNYYNPYDNKISIIDPKTASHLFYDDGYFINTF